MQPVPTTHTEKQRKQPSALATVNLTRKALSWGFIRQIKMKVLKMGIWSSSHFMIWALPTHHLLLVPENMRMDDILQCCF